MRAYEFLKIEDLEILFAEHPEIGAIRKELQRGKNAHVLVADCTLLHARSR